jgi:hypothetical protein
MLCGKNAVEVMGNSGSFGRLETTIANGSIGRLKTLAVKKKLKYDITVIKSDTVTPTLQSFKFADDASDFNVNDVV